MASNVLVLLVLLCSLMSAHCHHDGAPEQACFTMQPAHNGTTPLSITNPIHKINFAPAPALKDTNSSRQNMIVVTVTSTGSSDFKGFFMQAQSPANSDANPVGTWDVSGDAKFAKGVACGGRSASAVTHVDSSFKHSISLLWMPPPGFTGKVVFIATVVQDFNTYWVGIQSNALDVGTADSSVPQHPLGSAKNMISQPSTGEVHKTGNYSNSGNITQTSSSVRSIKGNTKLWISLLMLVRSWLW